MTDEILAMLEALGFKVEKIVRDRQSHPWMARKCQDVVMTSYIISLPDHQFLAEICVLAGVDSAGCNFDSRPDIDTVLIRNSIFFYYEGRYFYPTRLTIKMPDSGDLVLMKLAEKLLNDFAVFDSAWKVDGCFDWTTFDDNEKVQKMGKLVGGFYEVRLQLPYGVFEELLEKVKKLAVATPEGEVPPMGNLGRGNLFPNLGL